MSEIAEEMTPMDEIRFRLSVIEEWCKYHEVYKITEDPRRNGFVRNLFYSLKQITQELKENNPNG